MRSLEKANGSKDEQCQADPVTLIAGRLAEASAVNESIAKNQCEQIARIAKCIVDALKKGGKVVIFGNGGSAADAQHIAGELVGTFLDRKRRALPAIALNTNTSILTALANDFGYETVFSRQVEALVQRGDVAIGLSTSGKSPNVVLALKVAREKGAATIAFTGCGGGSLTTAVDYCFVVPSNSTPRIQEAHITVAHIVCELIEREFSHLGEDS